MIVRMLMVDFPSLKSITINFYITPNLYCHFDAQDNEELYQNGLKIEKIQTKDKIKIMVFLVPHLLDAV